MQPHWTWSSAIQRVETESEIGQIEIRYGFSFNGKLVRTSSSLAARFSSSKSQQITPCMHTSKLCLQLCVITFPKMPMRKKYSESHCSIFTGSQTVEQSVAVHILYVTCLYCKSSAMHLVISRTCIDLSVFLFLWADFRSSSRHLCFFGMTVCCRVFHLL